MKPFSLMFRTSLSILVLSLLTCNTWPQRPRKNAETISRNGASMLLHDHGRTTSLEAGAPGFERLLAECETALTSSQSMFKLAVLPATIEEIKAHEISLEIIYPAPREFRIDKLGKVVQLDRILIPLSGRYAEAAPHEAFVTLFYGVGDYRSGPYTNSGEFQDMLKNLLKELGYSVK